MGVVGALMGVVVVGGMVRGCEGQAFGLSVEKSGAFSVSHRHDQRVGWGWRGRRWRGPHQPFCLPLCVFVSVSVCQPPRCLSLLVNTLVGRSS